MRAIVPPSTANIFDFLRQLPVGLIASVAFLVTAFFVVLLWLEVAALNHAIRHRKGADSPEALQRMCTDLDRIEEQLAGLNRRLENLCEDKRRCKNGEG